MKVRIYCDPPMELSGVFEAALRSNWAALTLPSASLEVDHWMPGGDAPDDGKDVDVHVHFASDNANVALAEAVAAGRLVLPVVSDAPSAAGLPPELGAINAFLRDRHGANWSVALVDEVLTRTVLPTRTPQVFISYRRIDADPVAQQLHDAFTNLGYLVFLDTVSIRPADDFQHELMWRLNDTDVVILLGSPRLEESDWVLRELAFAMAASVGIALIRWPKACFTNDPSTEVGLPFARRHIVPDAYLDLEIGDLDIDLSQAGLIGDLYSGTRRAEHGLTKDALDRLVYKITSFRSIALRERQIDMLGHVHAQALRAGHEPRHGSKPGDLHITREGREHLIRVFPFRPEPVMLHTVARDAGPCSAVAAYAENAPRDPRAEALRWLGQRDDFCVEPFFGGTDGGRTQ